MDEKVAYSARRVFEGMKRKLIQYLEAQYHIWDVGLIGGRNSLLEAEGVIFQEPRLEAAPFYVPGKPYSQLQILQAAKDILSIASEHRITGIPEISYQHQASAIELFLGDNREIIVATGTGSGKTESFLMPILGSLAIESTSRPSSWELSGCRALLLYPMNALVNDQISRLRRLLGQKDVAKKLQGNRAHYVAFGMYTSRTPYPGEQDLDKDKTRLGSLIQKSFLDLSDETCKLLDQEGKFPAKNLERFVAKSFSTGPEDSEMFSRQEMQAHCPDVLVTNYSMLEYMLLRPIERSIFNQTKDWLAADKQNFFTVVLDEAHMYRGSGGAEVAYLLRRLHARLGIPRDRVRYILTSASLGSTPEAGTRMKKFAANLTGHEKHQQEFELITGEKQEKPNQRTASSEETSILAEYDYSTLHAAGDNLADAKKEFNRLVSRLGEKEYPELDDFPSFQNNIFVWLHGYGPAALIANKITSKPQKLRDICAQVFPDNPFSDKALESLLALMSFAKEKDTGRVYAPVRSHLFFRGLPGIYACINPNCNSGDTGRKGIMGKIHSSPKLTCECGSRVYEVLTHRDCGAAFIRGYLQKEHGDFLWHQPSEGLWGEGGLLEAHYLVEVNRRATEISGSYEGSSIWLHKTTGRLNCNRPNETELGQFVELLSPDGSILISGHSVFSFNNECPVCTRSWQKGRTKIMDLTTKGEAPFAQLIRTQVELQPQSFTPTDRSPNGGRKSLLFSDGRQKAARLARDIPREIESDVFRQLLLLGVKELLNINREPKLGQIYVAILHVLSKHSLVLFDGSDREHLRRDVKSHRDYYSGDLVEALEESPPDAPPGFYSLLLRHLGSPFYSVGALTLAHLVPAKKPRKKIATLAGISEDDLNRITIIWIQSFANSFAINANLARGVRTQAAGYPISEGLKPSGALKPKHHNFLREVIPNIEKVFDVLAQEICLSGTKDPGLFLNPVRIALELSSDKHVWFQCAQCSIVSPVEWWGCCPNCLAKEVTPVFPGATDYLRARKSFFRDPVIAVLEGKANPFNLSVEEHTAQLSHLDIEESTTTTEDFERRFRDILVSPEDTSIDVLSSTTTMEVGIDIGSLVAVGLRNVPPMRQNYQQRAGRTGRRGSAISTVVTYAQNDPHDSHYFKNPEPIIAGEPTLPSIDTENPKIIERHIRAQLIQSFFHSRPDIPGGSGIFSVLGKTMDFYNETGDFSLYAFNEWLKGSGSESAQDVYASILKWLPASYIVTPLQVAKAFMNDLSDIRPTSIDDLETSERNLIDFLFSRGFLPAYAFPRDLCALQIEGGVDRNGRHPKVRILQRPQQGLNVALSEYAPGRFVVVNKKTYRVGTVAANGSSSVPDRAKRLFDERRYYVYCPVCQYTAGFRPTEPEQEDCPLCSSTATLQARTVITPQVVFPEGHKEIDEYSDDQIFTNATNAQLSLPKGTDRFIWNSLGEKGQIAFARNQQLVMVNKGEEENGQHDGFLICKQCGKVALDSDSYKLGDHNRDYYGRIQEPTATVNV